MEDLSPLGEEGETRLRALAERRLEAVEGGADADELAGIAWWFSSGEFDTNWSLDFLRKALEAGCHPHPDHVIAERLAQLGGTSVRKPLIEKARGTQQSIIGYRIAKECASCGWVSEKP